MVRRLQRLRIAEELERIGRLLLLLATFCAASATLAVDDFEKFGELDTFEDAPLEEPISLPAWFKLSFLDLAEDLEEAIGSGKTGIMVYLGQKYCAYCKKLLHDNFDKLDILAYTQKHFDAIGIDIHGQRVVTNLQGREWTERSFAVEQSVDFTPTLIFYDTDKREALRLTGYYPPYKFRAALEYVAAGLLSQGRFPHLPGSCRRTPGIWCG